MSYHLVDVFFLQIHYYYEFGTLQENKYYEIMLNEFYKALIHELVNSEQIAEMAHEKTKSTAEIRINRIKNIWENRVKAIKILEQNHFNSIIIYGMGYVGNNLDYLLSASIHYYLFLNKLS